MAKRENMTEVSGGLSAGLDFGASKEVKKAPVEETPVEKPAVKPVQKPVADDKAKSSGKQLTDMYQSSIKEVEETRSKPFMVKIKPSTAEKMDRAVKKKIIKSRADLINFLLEQYFAELEEKEKK